MPRCCWLAAALLLVGATASPDISCECSIGGVTHSLVEIQCDRRSRVGGNELCRNERSVAVEEGYTALKHAKADKYDSLYRLYRTARHWDEANKACRRDGGYLAMPDSVEEFLMLGQFLKKQMDNRDSTAALGFFKTRGEKKYHTMGGTPVGNFTYGQWGARYPYVEPDQECMMVNWTSRGWPFLWSHDCSEPSPYLCERSLTPPVPADYEFVPGIGFFKALGSFLPFAMAESECLRNGGNIVVPDDQKEADVIMAAFDRFPGVERIYVGIDDRLRAGQFVTVHGEKMSQLEFQNWAPGALEARSADAHCVVMTSVGTYQLVDCDLPLPTICEWSVR